jgi:hypothetical protein
VKDDGDGAVAEAKAKLYRFATASCMYMMQWLHLDIFNTVHRLSRHMTVPREAHVQALMTLIRYVVSNENRGLLFAWKKGGVPSTDSRYMDDQTLIILQIQMMVGVSLVGECSKMKH